tara:strand:+ start:14856 stop:15077 length:222 start_codon:yes stop_codon:yes gene_type:complete
MFKYLFVLFIVVWLASDVKLGASVYAFNDNHISIEFPKAKLRSEENPDPWFSFYWNMESARDELQEINDAVVK